MASPDLSETDEGTTIGAERRNIVMESATEIGLLCELLRKHDDADFAVVRGVSARIDDLSAIIVRAMGDPEESTASISKDLFRR